MTPKSHQAKAERIMRSLDKLAADDYEARIEGAMLATTHWVNLTLHVTGIRSEDDDMIHTDYLTGAELARLEIVGGDLLQAMTAIEEFRAPHVRGAAANGPAAGEKALRSVEMARREALAAKAPALPFVTYLPTNSSTNSSTDSSGEPA